MKSEIEKKGANIKLVIELTETEWQGAIERAVAKISEEIKIAGFRPGKAPKDSVIAKAGEARVVSEAIDYAMGKYYGMALDEHKILPVTQPKVAVNQGDLNTVLKFTVEIVTLPEIKLGDYKKIKVKPQEIKIDDEKINSVIIGLQRKEASFNPVEREVKTGDWVEIDFEGKVDGVIFDGGSSKNHPLIVGDNVFLPDFEKAIIGMKTDEEKIAKVGFPKDYHQKNLAGKKADFTIKLHKIKEVKFPEIDDALAQKLGAKDLATLREDVKKYLIEEATNKESERQSEEAMTKLIDMAKGEIPQELIDQELSGMVDDLMHQLEHQKMSFEEYLKRVNTDEKGLRDQWKDIAKKRVLGGLALNEFRKLENIDATEAEVDAEIAKLKVTYPNQADEIVAKYATGSERHRMQHWIASRKAVEKLRQITTQ